MEPTQETFQVPSQPSLEMVAGVQTDDVLPSIERLEKSIDDIKGEITQLFDRLDDLAEDVDELKEKL